MPERRMPALTKSPPGLVERFAATLERFPEIEPRKMFGNASGFVGGNLATGLFADSWFVRLGEPERSEALALDGARPFEPMAGRAMAAYVVLPAGVVADDAAIETWVRRAVDHARTLPPKGR